MTGKVTRDDVARLAGVSTAVVSYVVNDGPRPVARATKKRVEQAIEQLNYRPNASARAMRLGRTDTFGLVVSEVTNTFHAEVVESIENKCLAKGKSVFLGHSHRNATIEREMLLNMVDRGVEGMLILMTSQSDAQEMVHDLKIPIVFLDRSLPVTKCETIAPDYFAGGKLATEHLLAHGCENILPVQGSLNLDNQNGRLAGYQDAMISAGHLPSKPQMTTWDRQGGYDAGIAILESGRPLPGGIFCFSDMIAVGLLSALQNGGIRVPQDVAVVGFDGTVSGEFSYPSLTSVKQPIDVMTTHAVDWLSQKDHSQAGHNLYPVELIVRGSCGC